jgi:hypothetical protein
MSFLKYKGHIAVNEKAIQMAHENAVNSIYKYERKTLAIVKMSHYQGFNFHRDALGKQWPKTDNFVMIGVLDETFASKRIHCEVKFTDHRPEDEFVGDCTLTHIGDEGQSYRRALMLSVSIWDADSYWREASYDCLRNAAISQNRFCHFRIATEITDVPGALAELRERGYCPTVRVHEFTMWPTIILPNAPDWAWKE